MQPSGCAGLNESVFVVMEAGQDVSQHVGAGARDSLLCGARGDPKIVDQPFGCGVDMQFAFRVRCFTWDATVDDSNSVLCVNKGLASIQADLHGVEVFCHLGGRCDLGTGIGVLSLFSGVIGIFCLAIEGGLELVARGFAQHDAKRKKVCCCGHGIDEKTMALPSGAVPRSG